MMRWAALRLAAWRAATWRALALLVLALLALVLLVTGCLDIGSDSSDTTQSPDSTTSTAAVQATDTTQSAAPPPETTTQAPPLPTTEVGDLVDITFLVALTPVRLPDGSLGSYQIANSFLSVETSGVGTVCETFGRDFPVPCDLSDEVALDNILSAVETELAGGKTGSVTIENQLEVTLNAQYEYQFECNSTQAGGDAGGDITGGGAAGASSGVLELECVAVPDAG